MICSSHPRLRLLVVAAGHTIPGSRRMRLHLQSRDYRFVQTLPVPLQKVQGLSNLMPLPEHQVHGVASSFCPATETPDGAGPDARSHLVPVPLQNVHGLLNLTPLPEHQEHLTASSLGLELAPFGEPPSRVAPGVFSHRVPVPLQNVQGLSNLMPEPKHQEHLTATSPAMMAVHRAKTQAITSKGVLIPRGTYHVGRDISRLTPIMEPRFNGDDRKQGAGFHSRRLYTPAAFATERSRFKSAIFIFSMICLRNSAASSVVPGDRKPTGISLTMPCMCCSLVASVT